MGLFEDVEACLPRKERDRRRSPSASVFDLMRIPWAPGECIEDLAVLRADQGWERLLHWKVMAPSTADLFISALYCRIITLSYSLVSALKRLKLPESWTALTLKALRFRLLAIPAFVVRHARTRWLRVSRAHPFLPMLCTLLP